MKKSKYQGSEIWLLEKILISNEFEDSIQNFQKYKDSLFDNSKVELHQINSPSNKETDSQMKEIKFFNSNITYNNEIWKIFQEPRLIDKNTKEENSVEDNKDAKENKDDNKEENNMFLINSYCSPNSKFNADKNQFENILFSSGRKLHQSPKVDSFIFNTPPFKSFRPYLKAGDSISPFEMTSNQQKSNLKSFTPSVLTKNNTDNKENNCTLSIMKSFKYETPSRLLNLSVTDPTSIKTVNRFKDKIGSYCFNIN